MIVPDEADHVTALFVVPETEALNNCCCPGASTTEAGLTETAMVAAGATCNWNVLDTPLSAALTVTAWAVLALLTLTWKLALVEPAGTVTDAGAVAAALVDDVLTLTTTPPVGAAPDNDTVHVEDAGTVIDEGLQVRPDRDGAGAFPVMLTLPPAPVNARAVPSGAAATAFVSWTAAVWLEADEDTISVTVAAVPLWIRFMSFAPVSKHVYEPVPATQSRVLPAAEAAAPTITFIPVKTEVGYESVHCTPAGPPAEGALNVSGRLTVEPAAAEPFDSPSVMPCPSTAAGSSTNRTSDLI